MMRIHGSYGYCSGKICDFLFFFSFHIDHHTSVFSSFQAWGKGSFFFFLSFS
jgi:hypothetical protein